MNKCECCGKDTIKLVKVDGVGLCCEHCARVILMELEERKTKEDKLIYGFLDNSIDYEDSDGDIVSKEAMLFYVDDNESNRHFFSISMIMPHKEMVVYFANEVFVKGTVHTTNYQFEVYGFEDSKEDLISKLMLKSAKGINYKTLEHDCGLSYVKSTGEMEVIYSDKYDCEHGWKVDGKEYSPEEAMRFFEAYEGWRILFQVTDKSNDVLEKDTLLMPIVMNEKTFVDELRELIIIFSDEKKGKYIYSENILGFDILFYKLINKLKFYLLHHPRGLGKLIGMKMIKMLENIDTDDDMFPSYEIGLIRDVISTNEEFNHPDNVEKYS